MKTGIVLFAHGSRVESANDAVRALAAKLAETGGLEYVRAAFLELGRPNLEESVGELVQAGVSRVVVVPYFLTLGLHMERDLPRLAEEISIKYNNLDIKLTPPMEGHPALVAVLLDRIQSV